MSARTQSAAGCRAAACEAAMQVIATLESRGGYPDDQLEALSRHYRRLDRRTRRGAGRYRNR